MGRFSEGGGFSNKRFVLKPDVARASEVSILSKNSIAITDFHAKKTQHVQLFENPLPGTPPFAIPNLRDQEKGVLAKGASAESSVTRKRTRNTQGNPTQQHISHSQRHSQDRRAFLQKPPSLGS